MTGGQAGDADQVNAPESGVASLPAVVAERQERVKAGFWRKLGRVAGRIPFAEDAVASYYCALDTDTPLRVRATLLGALLYFLMPIDAVPDVIAGLGFTDDASVLAGALALVASHITPRHRAAARAALQRIPPGPGQ